MYGRGAHAMLAMPMIESNSKEDVRSLRATISNKWFIGRPLKVGIVQVHVGEAVAGRGQIDQPRPGTHQRRNPVDEDKVSQVIGPELRLEPVCRVAERSGHDSRVGD